MAKRNTILIVFDELTCFKNLPTSITDNLPGYQLFKKKCIEFNNIQTSRQQCSPSRSTLMTGIYDTGLQDNIENNYQYDYIPTLPTNLETMGKIYKSLAKITNVNSQYNKINVLIKELDSKFNTLASSQLSNENIDYEKNKLVLHYCILIYNKGISANNLLDYFKTNHPENSEYYKFIFCYDIYKKEIRIEIFLIFIILYYYKINNKFNFNLFNFN